MTGQERRGEERRGEELTAEERRGEERRGEEVHAVPACFTDAEILDGNPTSPQSSYQAKERWIEGVREGGRKRGIEGARELGIKGARKRGRQEGETCWIQIWSCGIKAHYQNT